MIKELNDKSSFEIIQNAFLSIVQLRGTRHPKLIHELRQKSLHNSLGFNVVCKIFKKMIYLTPKRWRTSLFSVFFLGVQRWKNLSYPDFYYYNNNDYNLNVWNIANIPCISIGKTEWEDVVLWCRLDIKQYPYVIGPHHCCLSISLAFESIFR